MAGKVAWAGGRDSARRQKRGSPAKLNGQRLMSRGHQRVPGKEAVATVNGSDRSRFVGRCAVKPGQPLAA